MMMTRKNSKAVRHSRGRTAYLSGLAAEESVAKRYSDRGRMVIAQRWRGSRGEIDLIVEDGDELVFVEVKKSRTHAQAAARLSRRQVDRIYGAGSEFLATQPKGMHTPVRFDVALVDQTGQIEVIENYSMYM